MHVDVENIKPLAAGAREGSVDVMRELLVSVRIVARERVRDMTTIQPLATIEWIVITRSHHQFRHITDTNTPPRSRVLTADPSSILTSMAGAGLARLLFARRPPPVRPLKRSIRVHLAVEGGHAGG